MLAAAVLVAGLLPLAMPWDKSAPAPEQAQLVLTQPPPPSPPPPGSVIDLPDAHELPLNWRSTAKADGKTNPGLSTLLASGSGQFSRDQLYAVRGVLRGRRVVVVDLRQEPHTFLNGAALSWGPPEIVGTNRSAAQAEDTEGAWTRRLASGKFAIAAFFAPGIFADRPSWEPIALKLDIREAVIEARLVLEAHWAYLRIAMPDAVEPREEDLDRFVGFIRDLEQEPPWMYFHCDTGGNRTTLFLTLYDMMRNYFRASRPKIIARQRQLGGIDLLAGPARAARQDFLARFYSYCWQCGPVFQRNWSSWNREELRRRD